ncbi:MAG: SbcC/MukB-like Walker B domain-containing protein, partial [Myxococcota bacterium]|nr:SbcC/MukB-like Walker B domain-containing protein [Myxococcota bacterium]
NLDQLLRSANRHLGRLNERYRLRTETDETGLPTLEFVVEDTWRPGTPRSIKTLSGGESFLVSLALALGLSDLRTSSMPVETLLLDEGFGTLDPQTLDTALAALQQLQSAGRQVGIISHVVGLQERIQARIMVEPIGEGRSKLRPDLRT